MVSSYNNIIININKFHGTYKLHWRYTMTKCNKLLSAVIVTLVLTSNISILFAQASDYSKNWANREIDKWLSLGVVQTNGKGDFKPSEPIKRIDMAIMLNKLFNYQEKSGTKFSDIAADSSVMADVAKASAAGNFTGNGGKFRPNDPITRQEAAVVFARAFSLDTPGKNVVTKFKDAGKIAGWSKDAVNSMVGSGYMNGVPGNLFAPGDSITRAEAVKIIDNMAMDLKNKAGKYTGDVNGNLVVNTKSIILENMSIKGDLYLSEGIGNGEVTLNNVKIAGRTIVKGGGENSIVLNNTSLSGNLIIIKKDGKVRVVASGSSEISNIILNSGAKLEESNLTGKGFGDVDIIHLASGQQITLDGDFTSLDIEADGVKANIPDGSVGTVNIKEGTNGSKLNIGSTASVRNLVANDGVTVTGGSRIQNADINSNGVVLDTKPVKIDIAPGITASVAGTSTTAAPLATPTTPVAVVIPPILPPVAPPVTPPVTPPASGDNGGTVTPVQTPAGSVTVTPSIATINTIKIIDISYMPSSKTNNHTIVFTLPDEITATTSDYFYMASTVEISLSEQNISNSGKTVTVKNLDLRSTPCAIELIFKTLPSSVKALTFSVTDDCDGDQSAMSPSAAQSTTLNVVPTVSDLSCISLDTAIFANYTAPSGASSVVLKYRTGSGAWNEKTCTPTSTSVTINGLVPETTYEMKLLVTGGINAGESNAVTARTLKTPPALAPDTADNILGKDIELTFVDNSNWRDNIYAIDVSYLNYLNDGFKLYGRSSSAFTVAPGKITIKKDIIEQCGTCSIHVYAAGYPTVGVVQPILGAIRDLSCYSQSDSTASFHFSEATGATSVVMMQSTDKGATWTVSSLQIPLDSTSGFATVANLSSNTEYMFRLVVTGGACSGDSNTVSVLTGSNIQNLSVCDITNDMASFDCSPLKTNNVTLQYLESGIWHDVANIRSYSIATTGASIMGLTANTSYTYRLKINDGINAGYTNPVSVTTESNLQSLMCQVVQHNGAYLTFGTSLTDATSAELIVTSGNGAKWECTVTPGTSPYHLEGLAPESHYMLQMHVIGGYFAGYSNILTIETNAVPLESRAPYVTAVRAIEADKLEITFDQNISVNGTNTFVLRSGPSTTSPIMAGVIATFLNGKKINLTLTKSLSTDFNGVYLDVADCSEIKSAFNVQMSTAGGILASGPIAVPDNVKATVKSTTATIGGIIIEFSEAMTTSAADFAAQELVLTKDGNIITVTATSVSAVEGDFTAGFTKLKISGLESRKDYNIQLMPKGITRDKSEYFNWFKATDLTAVTPK
jgi:chitodextrinase